MLKQLIKPFSYTELVAECAKQHWRLPTVDDLQGLDHDDGYELVWIDHKPHEDERLRYAYILARKVRETRNIVEEKSCLFRDIRKDGERYFKDHELRALAEIGGTWSIIEMSRTGELRDRIFDLYKDKIKDKVRTEKQIAGKQPVKQVASFVEKALGGKA